MQHALIGTTLTLETCTDVPCCCMTSAGIKQTKNHQLEAANLISCSVVCLFVCFKFWVVVISGELMWPIEGEVFFTTTRFFFLINFFLCHCCLGQSLKLESLLEKQKQIFWVHSNKLTFFVLLWCCSFALAFGKNLRAPWGFLSIVLLWTHLKHFWGGPPFSRQREGNSSMCVWIWNYKLIRRSLCRLLWRLETLAFRADWFLWT